MVRSSGETLGNERGEAAGRRIQEGEREEVGRREETLMSVIQEVKGNELGSGGMPLQASATTFGVNHGRQERARMRRWGRGGGWEEGALLLWDQKGRCGQNMGRHGESGLRRRRAGVKKQTLFNLEENATGQSGMRRWHNLTPIFINMPGSIWRNKYGWARIEA